MQKYSLEKLYGISCLHCCQFDFKIKVQFVMHLSILENYILYANTPGYYMLFSPVQKENGPRLFDPYFGFMYRGLSSSFRVLVLQNSVLKLELTPGSSGVPVNFNNWNYFSKNLSTIPFFTSAWNTGAEWEVRAIVIASWLVWVMALAY